jgi:RNA polymerase sigma factor (sigma-70 family)
LKHTSRQEFDAKFAALLNSSSSSGSAFPTITHYLKIYKLDGFYSSSDILAEAYIRGVKTVESGVSFQNVPAWVRRTCINIIRELSRRHKRYQLITDSQLANIASTSTSSYELLDSWDENIRNDVRNSFMQIDPQDQEILHLRLILDLSWQEVCEYLQKKGEITSVPSVRKRGQRALMRLRKAYNQISEVD